MKTCTKCGETKPLTEFYYDKQRDRHYASCKKCKYEYAKAHRKNPESWYARRNSEYKRDYRSRTTYGVSLDEYQTVMDRGECEVCGKTEDLVYHHHHDTMKAACLCRQCNSGIGLLKDDPDTLLKAYKLQRKLSNETGHF